MLIAMWPLLQLPVHCCDGSPPGASCLVCLIHDCSEQDSSTSRLEQRKKEKADKLTMKGEMAVADANKVGLGESGSVSCLRDVPVTPG